MADRTALYLLTDRALTGQLDLLLVRWARAKASRRVAAHLLAEELGGGVWINPTTVQRWTAEALAAVATNGDQGEAA